MFKPPSPQKGCDHVTECVHRRNDEVIVAVVVVDDDDDDSSGAFL